MRITQTEMTFHSQFLSNYIQKQNKNQNFAGDIVERSSFEAQVDASDIEKGTYPFYMLRLSVKFFSVTIFLKLRIWGKELLLWKPINKIYLRNY